MTKLSFRFLKSSMTLITELTPLNQNQKHMIGLVLHIWCYGNDHADKQPPTEIFINSD